MKYIDAEKLIAEIEDRLHCNGAFDEVGDYGWHYDKGMVDAYNHIKEFITSLQQEQPEVDLVAELKHHISTTPKEQLEKEWKELEPWGNIGPTVQEFLYGKQPEVDLEKEIEEWWQNWVSPPRNEYAVFNKEEFINIVRHFYELGLNARKEETK